MVNYVRIRTPQGNTIRVSEKVASAYKKTSSGSSTPQLPKSATDIINFDPSKTYGGTYTPDNKPVRYGVDSRGNLYTSGGGRRITTKPSGRVSVTQEVSQQPTATPQQRTQQQLRNLPQKNRQTNYGTRTDLTAEDIRKFNEYQRNLEKAKQILSSPAKFVQDVGEASGVPKFLTSQQPYQVPDQPFYSPENIKRTFQKSAELPIGIAEEITSGAKAVVDVFKPDRSSGAYQLFFNTSANPIPISRQQTKEIIGGAFQFNAFSPFLSTATAAQLESQYADEVVEVSYNGQRVKMTLSEAKARGLSPMTRQEALGEFGRASQEKQLDILKTAFKNRYYLDEKSQLSDIVKATKFMKESGLSKSKIESLLRQLFPERFKVTTPVIQSKGQLLGELQTQTAQATTPTRVISSGLSMDVPQIENVGSKISPITGQSIFGSESQYAGTGQYERTGLVSVNLQSLKSGNNLFIQPKIESAQVQSSNQRNNLLSISAVTPRSASVSKSAQRNKLESKQASALVSVLKAAQQTKTQQQLRSQQKTKDVLKYREQLPKELSKTRSKKKKFESGFKSQTKKQSSENELFSVLGRRFGKDVSLGTFTTKPQAERELFKFLKSTLGRSGKIKKGEEELSFGELDLFKGGEFRPAKRDSKRIVQKAKFSLSSPFEKREIQYFKRKSGKKKAKGFLSWI